MDTIAKVRFRRSVGKESISSITRELNLSRPTVRKHCRTQTEPIYRRAQQPTPMLGAFQDRLESWLQTEKLLPKAQRRTARRLFEGLQAEGYRGAYAQHGTGQFNLDPRQWHCLRPGGHSHDRHEIRRRGCRATHLAPPGKHLLPAHLPVTRHHGHDRARLHRLRHDPRLGLLRPLPPTARTGQYFHTAVHLRLRVVISVDHYVGPKLPASGRSTILITRNARRAWGLRLRKA
jgi:hypothetical protein